MNVGDLWHGGCIVFWWCLEASTVSVYAGIAFVIMTEKELLCLQISKQFCQSLKTSSQMIYFISSLLPKVRAIAKHVRDHWKVENQMHWSLDVTFAEDASRIRKGNGQQIAAMSRRLVLSIIKRDRTEKCSLRLKRRLASWNMNHLTQFLTGPPA